MKVRYFNQQDESDPMNRMVIVGGDKLSELLDARRKRAPYIAELSADNGYQLTLGIGGDLSFSQYMHVNGELPYLVACPSQLRTNSKYVNFLINSTPTPIPGNFVLTFDEMKEIAIHFLKTGERSDGFSWVSI